MKKMLFPILSIFTILSCSNDDVLENELNLKNDENNKVSAAFSPLNKFTRASGWEVLKIETRMEETGRECGWNGTDYDGDLKDDYTGAPLIYECNPIYTEIRTEIATPRKIADVNGDGNADIIGFGYDDVIVSLSNGNSFGTPQIWNSGYTNGWNINNHMRTVADVNGDDKADIIGFGNDNVLVSLSTGSSFGTPQIWHGGFTNGWNNSTHVRRVEDVNGDGKADIIGFGNDDVLVSLSTGSSFGTPQIWHSGYTNGWYNSIHVRIVKDVNGDGSADIVGFGNDNVLVALSNGSSFSN